MTKEPDYPLKQIVEVKKKRVEEAERVVMEKKLALEKEQKKLAEVEAARDVVLRHYQEKLTQLREVLDAGTNSTTIKQMKDYLKIVKDKLEKEQVKVKEQQKNVDAALKNLEAAQKVLKEKRQEADKLDIHQEQWTKEAKTEMRKEEEKQQDEVGTTIFLSQKKKRQPPT
jgi:flagellar biosynthesis chaperone FliJ